MRNEGNARRHVHPSTERPPRYDLRPRGRTGSSGGRDRANRRGDTQRASLGRFPAEAPGQAGSTRFLAGAGLRARGHEALNASPTVRCFPVQTDQCSSRRSFPHTAAGQRRNWPYKAAQASLLTLSFHRDTRIKTTSGGKVRSCVDGRQGFLGRHILRSASGRRRLIPDHRETKKSPL